MLTIILGWTPKVLAQVYHKRIEQVCVLVWVDAYNYSGVDPKIIAQVFKSVCDCLCMSVSRGGAQPTNCIHNPKARIPTPARTHGD